MSTQEAQHVPRDSSVPSLPQLSATGASEGSLGATFADSEAATIGPDHQALAEMEKRVLER